MGVDGRTANDVGDVDTGPNQLQNFPVLNRAVAGTTTRVIGTLSSVANSTFSLDFFLNQNDSEAGGQQYVGSTSVTTDASGNASLDTSLAVTTSAGQFITATATDVLGNTSEFSGTTEVVVGTTTIGGTLFGDLDRSRNQSLGEEGISGVVVVLHSSATGLEVARTSSGAQGTFQFSDVVPGSYSVSMDLVRREEQTFPVGKFAASQSVTTSPYVRSAVLEDFDGDGDQDLALTSEFAGTITVYLDQGNGQFVASATLDAPVGR